MDKSRIPKNLVSRHNLCHCPKRGQTYRTSNRQRSVGRSVLTLMDDDDTERVNDTTRADQLRLTHTHTNSHSPSPVSPKHDAIETNDSDGRSGSRSHNSVSVKSSNGLYYYCASNSILLVVVVVIAAPTACNATTACSHVHGCTGERLVHGTAIAIEIAVLARRGPRRRGISAAKCWLDVARAGRLDGRRSVCASH